MDINDDFSFPSISTHFNNPVSQLSISTSLWRISSLIYPDFDGGGEDSGRSSSKGPDSCKMDMLWEDLEVLDAKTEETAEKLMRVRLSGCNYNGYFDDDDDDEVYSCHEFGSKLADHRGIEEVYSSVVDTKTAYKNITSTETSKPKTKRASGIRLMQRALKKLLFLQNIARNKRK